MPVHIVDVNETNPMRFEQIVRKVGSDLDIVCFADPVKALAALS